MKEDIKPESPSSSAEGMGIQKFKSAGDLVDYYLGTKDPSEWAFKWAMATAIEGYASQFKTEILQLKSELAEKGKELYHWVKPKNTREWDNAICRYKWRDVKDWSYQINNSFNVSHLYGKDIEILKEIK